LRAQKAEGELAAASDAIEPYSTIEAVSDDYLHAAIEALEPEHREVIELCYLKQMRYREAAEVLGVPIGTIGTRLMRARVRLSVLLLAIMRNGRK
jgi:RNA polymerase sigma factor (sigma-70 family)